jgi:hypothetical protein
VVKIEIFIRKKQFLQQMEKQALLSFGKQFFDSATARVIYSSDCALGFTMPEIVFEDNSLNSPHLPFKTKGRAYRNENVIVMSEKLEMPYAMETLSHEIMHIIRYDIEESTPKSNGEARRFGKELQEFFSHLNKPACEIMGFQIADVKYLSLEDMMKGRKITERIGSTIPELEKTYGFAKDNGVLTGALILALEKARFYIYSSAMVSDRFLSEAENSGEQVREYLITGEESKLKSAMLGIEALIAKEKQFSGDEGKRKKMPYITAQIAVAENYNDLLTDWEQAMLMTAEEADEKYLLPIKKKLCEMRENHA